jgi:hypothetical protein
VNKKKQKNFDYLNHLAPVVANPVGKHKFFASFFKKEALSSVSKQPLSCCRGASIDELRKRGEWAGGLGR